MEFSRRTFLKSTLVGGVGISALGFDLTPAYAQTQSLKISRTTETRSTCPYCSVSCGVIIHTHRRQSEERHSAGGPRRRRSRSPDQSRHALPQGIVACSRTS